MTAHHDPTAVHHDATAALAASQAELTHPRPGTNPIRAEAPVPLGRDLHLRRRLGEAHAAHRAAVAIGEAGIHRAVAILHQQSAGEALDLHGLAIRLALQTHEGALPDTGQGAEGSEEREIGSGHVQPP